MRPVDFLSSLGHYGAHTAPIWRALAPEERGTWWVPDSVQPEVAREGVARTAMRHGRPREPGRPCVVASAGDAALCGDRPVVLVEHGAGQAYDKENPSYSGGPGRDNVVLFLTPNGVAAGRNRARYPRAAHEVVGSPRLDDLIARARGADPDPHAVALSFHWDSDFVPETRWAFPWYKRVLPEVVAAHPTVGHGHPRFAVACANTWGRLGIPHEPDFAALVDRARLYVCDNSSTIYEWAALGRPVVVLNAPWHRRHLDAWPRFWRCADVGVQCDDPADILGAIDTALEDPQRIAERRAEVVEEVFPLRDGRAAARAADALRAVLG